MPNTYTKLLYHLVFSTKERRSLIDANWEDRLYSYIGGIVRHEKGDLLAAGGTADHIHLLVRYRADVAISDLLRSIKSNSSRWLHETFPESRDFAWQEGYSAFTVSQSAVEDVKRYIANQKEHHRRRDFKEELLAILRLHEIEFDEKYVFD
jgi:REP element-mobilizing transposase RayT